MVANVQKNRALESNDFLFTKRYIKFQTFSYKRFSILFNIKTIKGNSALLLKLSSMHARKCKSIGNTLSDFQYYHQWYKELKRRQNR